MTTRLLKQEEENFLRLVRVVLHDIPSKLQNMFKGEFANKYGMPYADDTASGQFFLSNVPPRSTCRDAKVKSAIQNGDSTVFDCTTLFYCLVYSGALLLPPMRKKNARVPPFNSSELIDQLREQRNLLAHSSSAEVSQLVFNTRVNDLNTIYQQLGWSCTDLQQAANGPMNTAECFRLQQELLKEAANNKALARSVQSLRVQLQTVQGQLRTTTRDVVTVKRNLQTTTREVAAVKGRLQRTTHEVVAAKGKLDRTTSEAAAVKRKLQNTTCEIVSVKRKHQTTTRDVVAMKRRLQTTTGEVVTVKRKLETTTSEVAAVKTQGQENADQLQQQATKLEVHEQQLQDFGTAQEKMAAQVHRQEQENDAREARVKDELKKFEESLKVVQQQRIEEYLSKKEAEDENYTVKELNELYVDLRIHNKKENYTRLEIRTHYDLLELQRDVDSCHPIQVNDLFQPEREGASTPRRVLVIGKAGIGKTMLTMHILDKWVNGMLPCTFQHVFYFALRDLSLIRESSLTDLFFEHHDQEIPKPSDEATTEFFKRISENPGRYLLIMDGVDEYGNVELGAKQYKHKRCVEMRKLLSSIIQGNTLGRVTVIVTSRPGGIKDDNLFHKTAEIYGLTPDKISEYITKFCRGDNDLNTCIGGYIRDNTNIASLCYIPVQCDLVCRIVRAKEISHSVEELPATITQLYITAVENLAIEHHPLFKGKEVEDDDNVVAKLREPLLKHAKLARDGMGQSPIKVTFSKKEIDDLDLEKAATKCGLLTISKEKKKKKAAVLRKYTCTFSFNHLTMQEFLGAVALVSSPQEAESMMMTSENDGQLDLVLMFLCGLIGDHTNKEFLDSLDCPIQMTSERLLELVIQREREKTARDHKQSVLLLLLLIFESQHPELWSTVGDYVMEDGETLDLSEQHISPVELQAVTFVFKNSDFNSLSLKDCYLPGIAAETLASALHQLPRLTQLSVGGNTFSDAATSQALVESVSKMTSLWKLDLEDCELSGVATEALAVALHQLPGLTELRVGGNTFSDATTSQALVEGVLKMTSLRKLDLERCYLSGAATEALANALHQLPLLTELGLSDCDIPANAMMALAGGLRHLTALEELGLENNIIDAAAAAALCRSLSQLRQLETLRFQGCHMDDTISVDIAKVAHKLHRLDDLGLVKNHITDDGVERVKEIWGRRRKCVNLRSQEPPSERCGSRCDGGLYELFYRRPLSHDNSDSGDNDNLSSDDNSDSDDNDNLSSDNNSDSDGNDNLSLDDNGDSDGNDNLSSDDNDGNDNLSSDDNSDSNGNDNLSSDDNSNHDDNWMSSDDNH